MRIGQPAEESLNCVARGRLNSWMRVALKAFQFLDVGVSAKVSQKVNGISPRNAVIRPRKPSEEWDMSGPNASSHCPVRCSKLTLLLGGADFVCIRQMRNEQWWSVIVWNQGKP